jgi:RNA polymerase sigma factor (TIGR02999 family)
MPAHEGVPAQPSASSGPVVPDAPPTIDHLFPVVYDELRRVAHRQLRREPSGHTLGTTALVHEVYLRLANRTDAPRLERSHFLALAARAMRHVLVDCARRYRSARRGGGAVPSVLHDNHAAADQRAELMVDLDEALVRLGEREPRLATLVECRFFAGLTEDETATVLGVTSRTVRREWVRAKSWLYLALRD